MFEFLIFIYVVICVAFYVLYGISFMKLAKIAGRNDIAWMAWVPVCNSIQQLLLIKKSGWWVLMYFVPIANFIFAILWQIELLNAYKKNGAYVLFNIFLSPVYLILWVVWAFSADTRYVLDEKPPINTVSI
ncbi:DUF5684 domain-containing protein [Bacillus sp. FJAT-49736]|uniref:DUF5684 domain-containing protein n=1 Tax=Bacillus sp. FJAT-49736 TaxID=2833582 RepID=UPI001BCA0B62|nr:DUF5684 domain-containing protein [Bacillus sp. FJAT-49736]MBS4174231.1 hypothetical protein [Bacillus sp. FJAT-49736]